MAMATETSVVGPDMSPVNDIVVNQDTGLLVPAGDRAAYVAAVNWLLANDEARARFGARGRARVRACFDERIAFAKIEETYRRLRHQT